ncbi:hypothetical protein [Microbacterium sp. NPDC087665]|uniref:hypothetical protein n=1 Tax=Microbacterium sp. NPDC087665 TaxID=3364194 RepID=UPI003813F4F2
MTKKKTSRWQALMLAGLVLAGGAVAVPNAATAAPVKSSSQMCSTSVKSCSHTVRAKNEVWFRVVSPGASPTLSYTVKTISGRVLCRGTITPNHGNRSCWFGTYTGSVTIKTTKHTTWLKIYATY